jgi:hypothetical protein
MPAEDDTAKATTRDALELVERGIDVERQQRLSEQALWSRAEVLRQPVVVGPHAGQLKPGIPQVEQAHAEARIQHLGLDAVRVHVSQARHRIPAAAAHLVERHDRAGSPAVAGTAKSHVRDTCAVLEEHRLAAVLERHDPGDAIAVRGADP